MVLDPDPGSSGREPHCEAPMGTPYGDRLGAFTLALATSGSRPRATASSSGSGHRYGAASERVDTEPVRFADRAVCGPDELQADGGRGVVPGCPRPAVVG